MKNTNQPETRNQKLKTNIDFANLQYQYQLYKDEIDEAIHKVLDKSNYIMGEEVKELEKNLCKFICWFHVLYSISKTVNDG